MDESKLDNLLVAIFFLFIILTKLVATRTRTSRLNGADTKTLNGEITSGGKSDGYRLLANPMWQPLCKILAHSLILFTGFAYRHERMSC